MGKTSCCCASVKKVEPEEKREAGGGRREEGGGRKEEGERFTIARSHKIPSTRGHVIKVQTKEHGTKKRWLFANNGAGILFVVGRKEMLPTHQRSAAPPSLQRPASRRKCHRSPAHF